MFIELVLLHLTSSGGATYESYILLLRSLLDLGNRMLDTSGSSGDNQILLIITNFNLHCPQLYQCRHTIAVTTGQMNLV